MGTIGIAIVAPGSTVLVVMTLLSTSTSIALLAVRTMATSETMVAMTL